MPVKRTLRRKRVFRKRRVNFNPKRTNKSYHSPIPRTLQIATTRNKSIMMKYVTNQTYYLHPQVRTEPADQVGSPENMYLVFRANSIVDIMNQTAGNGVYNTAGTWQSQDPPNYGPTQALINARGVNEWEQKYQHFTVLGSRITATCQTVASNQTTAKELPGTFYLNLSGYTNLIKNSTQPSEINDLPYTKRARIISAASNNTFSASSSVPGARLSLNYSTKRFEGVTDPMDNQALKGQFTNSFHPQPLPNKGAPLEGSFFTVGFIPTMPYSATAPNNALLQDQLVTIRLEHIVKLTEPTDTNQVSGHSQSAQQRFDL